MANTTTPLTNTQVKQAKAKTKEYNLADGGGLALRIKPNGSKLWLFNYSRPYTKKRANLSLGAYPDISLAEARKLKREYRELLAKDIDPKEFRDEKQLKESEAHNNTLKYVAAQWFEVKKGSITASHAEDTWRSLELHVFPDLGNVPIHKLTAKKAITYIQPLAKKGYLETVKRVCQRLNEIMTYSTNAGLITANPLAGIGKAFGVPDKKHMPTIRPEKLPELMKKINHASIRITTRCLLKWQLHTMVRPSEAAGTRWDEIDLEKKLWNIPPERMKKKRAHIVPLSDQAIEILEEMRPLSGMREHVFPADRKPRLPANSSTANMALKRMGYGGVLTAH
ncbi:MAG: integrase arm-type DNA-binding domain-containing protein, partial [Gammaproteobacteria bacterium]|nr:integrase arm-type DNA-binding domain-containing protein [Gammaproteobacteria bacterium]